MTSRKKRDTILSLSNTNTGTGNSTGVLATSPLTLNGATGGTVLFCPTARSLRTGGSSNNTVVEQAARTATRCYARGYSEHIRVQTSSAVPWMWRRICFTARGGSAFTTVAAPDNPTVGAPTTYSDTSVGMSRAAVNQAVNAMPATIVAQQSVLFKGALNRDWFDQLIAPVDNSRVKVFSDKTYKLHTGNQSGYFGEKKLWYPMNSTLVYDDDESGQDEFTSYLSTDATIGMGDYYIYDIFVAGVGAGATDLLALTYNGTYYWHER